MNEHATCADKVVYDFELFSGQMFTLRKWSVECSREEWANITSYPQTKASN